MQALALSTLSCPAEFVWKMTPALAAGNTLVIKVSKETSLTALLVGDLALQAGFPPGVLNILTGPGKSLGDALVQHPLVDKVGTL
jgi:aldehyde dehydrogenase (NAD+)